MEGPISEPLHNTKTLANPTYARLVGKIDPGAGEHRAWPRFERLLTVLCVRRLEKPGTNRQPDREARRETAPLKLEKAQRFQSRLAEGE